MKSIKRMTKAKEGRRWIVTGTRNAVKFSKGKAETNQHRIAKALICANLSRCGIEYYTECELKTGGRADIYIPELELAVEILQSETRKQLIEKSYPCRMAPIDADLVTAFEAHYVVDALIANPEETIQLLNHAKLSEFLEKGVL